MEKIKNRMITLKVGVRKITKKPFHGSYMYKADVYVKGGNTIETIEIPVDNIDQFMYALKRELMIQLEKVDLFID